MLHRYAVAFASVLPLLAQSTSGGGSAPIYRVTIVERTTPAINYGYRTEPTKIDFRGTALLPFAKGDATVESRRGARVIDAHFEHVPPASRFGPDCLTYVVWAISTEGRAQNLGELVLNGSDKGSLVASTSLQSFALIVTAEPYAVVSQPGDFVVMENRVREDTTGKVEQVNASYELMPRNPIELNWATKRPPSVMKPVPQHEYEAIVALYEAENAVRIARASDAGRLAPERLAGAETLLNQARVLSVKDQSREVVSTAHEAAQIAEDAKAIALRRGSELRVAEAEQQRQQAEAEKQAALAAEQNAQAAAAAAEVRARQALAEARLEREQQEQQARAAQAATAEAPAIQGSVPSPAEDRMRADQEKQNRARLTQELRAQGFQTLDTPRGVVAVIPSSMLNAASGRESVRAQVASLASRLQALGAVQVDVEGYTDSSGSAAEAQTEANVVTGMLTADGLPAAEVTARGMGDSRPMASNRSAAGRQQNRRVEIVINGGSIGDMPVWDHAYALVTR